IRKPIHKKLIYQKFSSELSGDKKSRFDEDISRITITNEILNITKLESHLFNASEPPCLCMLKLESHHYI
ncbi:MAG: hypothetical protein IJ749_08230, partial [Eubacterium sp.]|nr:hypothetical protein [Eubacterium sp.]